MHRGWAIFLAQQLKPLDVAILQAKELQSGNLMNLHFPLSKRTVIFLNDFLYATSYCLPSSARAQHHFITSYIRQGADAKQGCLYIKMHQAVGLLAQYFKAAYLFSHSSLICYVAMPCVESASDCAIGTIAEEHIAPEALSSNIYNISKVIPCGEE